MALVRAGMKAASAVSPASLAPNGPWGSMLSMMPVSIGGAAVLPGYAVLADASGVLFIAPEDLDAVLEEGELKTERGRISEVKVSDGTHLGQLSGATKMVEGKLAG